jgi:hypothetical protein
MEASFRSEPKQEEVLNHKSTGLEKQESIRSFLEHAEETSHDLGGENTTNITNRRRKGQQERWLSTSFASAASLSQLYPEEDDSPYH